MWQYWKVCMAKTTKNRPSIAEIDNMSVWHSMNKQSLYNSFLLHFHTRTFIVCYPSPLSRLYRQALSLLPQYYCECCPHPRNYHGVWHKINPITTVVPSSPSPCSSLNCITKFGYCQDMLPVICLWCKSIVTRRLKLRSHRFHIKVMYLYVKFDDEIKMDSLRISSIISD